MYKIDCWLENSLERVYKNDSAMSNNFQKVNLAQNDKGSFQVCLRKKVNNGDIEKVNLKVEASKEIEVKARKIGYVPVPHFNTQTEAKELAGNLPGYVPDPLFENLEMTLVPGETCCYWISVITHEDTPAGTYPVNLILENEEGNTYQLKAEVDVYPLKIKERTDFPVTHWFYADALCDWYEVKPFDDKFWKIVKPYIQDLKEHGVNVIHTPIFTPPTDGIKRPNQLLKIKKIDRETYSFDWSDVRKWVNMALDCGMEYFEWVHFFSQWGVENALRIYENYDGCYEDDRLLWPPETAADSETYRNFLSQFLPEFKQFLEEENILEKSFFHVSDEPHGEEHLNNYKKARAILKELAPWMKVMDALSETAFAEITDMPIASIKSSREFREKNIPHWDYFCCGPRGPYLNRLLDTPLAKIRGTGWLLYQLNALGFLHWGYNYWYKSQTRKLIDPFKITDAKAWPGWAYGDPFVVYPGEKGPIDSIRWEVFSESLKDYALLQTLDLENDNNIISSFKSYKNYPKDSNWYQINRALLISKNV
ncbi:MAG: DUF4091 domain-containing protein [Bacillota bacterium]